MTSFERNFILVFGLLCGAVFGWNHLGAMSLNAVEGRLEAPLWRSGLLQRPGLERVSGSGFLCRLEDCSATPDWPVSDAPEAWLKALGHDRAKRGRGARPDAPALVRTPEGWVVLWGERSDRLEVVLEGRGAGVWPRSRFRSLYDLPWWGPLR
jgi:hypothetical protein